MYPWFLGFTHRVPFWLPIFPALILWSLASTGFALWHAARRGDKGWFVFFLLVHTVGIVEMYYLYAIARVFSPSKPFAKRKKK